MRRIPLLSTLVLSLCTLATIKGACAAPSPAELAGPVAQYKIYVMGEAADLVARTRVFTDAVKMGDLAKARSLYASARAPYERIEPIAELFDDLDKSIDSRADDHGDNSADAEITGFHRIEHELFAKNSTAGLAPMAARLLADIVELQARIKRLDFPPGKVIGGAAALIEEVAATKISGEEERYSHTDLSDFDANLAGAKAIVTLFRPLLLRHDAARVGRIETDFGKLEIILARYRTADGFESYETLKPADRNLLQGPITTLAEDLSALRGVLGLN